MLFYNGFCIFKFVNMSKRHYKDDLRTSEVDRLLKSQLGAVSGVDVPELSEMFNSVI